MRSAPAAGLQLSEQRRLSTFVLIHGAGDVGWYWHRVEAELRARGHDVVAPDLPADDDSLESSEGAGRHPRRLREEASPATTVGRSFSFGFGLGRLCRHRSRLDRP